MNECQCFDFSVSWWFYRAHCREMHGFDPGDNELPEETPEPIPQAPEWTRGYPGRVTYSISMEQSLAFKTLKERVQKLEGRLHKYFEGKRKVNKPSKEPF